MNIKEAVDFCDQNHSHTLYALDINDEGELKIYSIHSIPFEPQGKNIACFCKQEKLFDKAIGYVTGYDFKAVAELSKDLVFFSEHEIGCNDIFTLEFLMARFPSLKAHQKSKKGFVRHAIECIRSFNRGVAQKPG